MHFLANLTEINADTWPYLDSQLRDALTDGFHIPKIPVFETVDANSNPTASADVETAQPFGERFVSAFILTYQDFSWD